MSTSSARVGGRYAKHSRQPVPEHLRKSTTVTVAVRPSERAAIEAAALAAGTLPGIWAHGVLTAAALQQQSTAGAMQPEP